MEDVFIQIGKGQQDDPVYVMNTAEKDCLDSFMAARNNALVWGKSNVDKSGKATIFDELGREVVSSDGKKNCRIIFNYEKSFNSVNPEMGIPSQVCFYRKV